MTEHETIREGRVAAPPRETTSDHVGRIQEEVSRHSAWVEPLRREVAKVIVGQDDLVEKLLIGVLADGHVLLEGVPGLAKTLALKTLATGIHADFRRIQFTPDMLPADIIGTEVFDPERVRFDLKKGPVFANLILADEINRAPAKVQSALLEAMQERQVTIGEQTIPLPQPFLVLATQNPIEQEGTYALPEAQVDRFLLKVRVTYPSADEERLILDLADEENPGRDTGVRPVVDIAEILASRQVVRSVFVDPRVKDYIVSLVHATRTPERFDLQLDPYIECGASPRASLALQGAARAHAFLQGHGYVTPQNVKAIAMEVLRHRVSLSYEAEAEGLTSDLLVERIVDAIPVP